MRKRSMPQARQFERPDGLRWEISPQSLERWTPNIMAATETDNTISVLDPIGIDPWTGDGVTAKRIAAALRSIGAENDVVVNIHSPGGDMFEGIAIYSLLREHKGSVTVKVLSLAASAASIIAMAGDEIMIARAGFLMVHNTWVLARGNRHDLRGFADYLEPFDAAMADIYAARSGIDAKAIGKIMDKETWINGAAAIDQGFADALLPSDDVRTQASARRDVLAARRIEAALSHKGLSRSEARALMNEFKSGTRDAAGTGTPGATGEENDGTRDAADASDDKYLAALRSYVKPVLETQS